MPKIQPITPERARRTIAHRLGRVADRVRQVATNLGARPLRVFLVWTVASGEERGEGEETELVRVEILPTPLVTDLSALALNPLSAGRYPVGTLRVTEISVVSYTRDVLIGAKIPVPLDRPIDARRISFFYELVEDGRGDDPPKRHRCRVMSEPDRKADEVQWVVMLERMAEDRDRAGMSQLGTDPDRGGWL